MKEKGLFRKGLKDGVPTGLGYFAVSIGIGIAAVSGGLNVLTAVLISMTNLTSAGQAAGIAVIAAGGTFLEIALVQLVINLRYSLMAISLAQRLDDSFTTGHRLFLGTFITDENFAVASGRKSLNIRYMYGLVLVPYVGWAAGTWVGATAGTILPASVTTALGLALYGMFIAIIVPAVKQSSGAILSVGIAVVLSTALKLLPCFSGISYGFSVIIASVTAAAVAAYLSVRRVVK